MRIILTISILLLVFFTSAQTTNSKFFKIWSSTDTLNWEDFGGLDDGSSHAASIYWELMYNTIDSTKFEVFARMDRRKSWWRITGSHLLRHEQYHFNITEIFARLIRMNVIEKKLSPRDFEFSYYFNKYLAECGEMQKQYDKTTEHSKNADNQLKWEIYIDKQLSKFEKYQDQVITVP